MLFIVLSVLVAAALGLLLNIAANLIQPHIEKKTRLLLGSILFLLVATSAITFHTTQNASQSTTSSQAPQVSPTIVPADNASHSLYETEAHIEEGKSYVDPETGFVFAVDEISNFWLSKLLNPNAGVLCRYTLPDGTTASRYRRKVGTRADFQYMGRKFYMAIKDVNYSNKVATIVIKETPSK